MMISVILPVYKVEIYLHRCVDSILSQIYKDFELILVDDGSPDNCEKICDEYMLKENRIVVIHKENGGLSRARNAGLDWAFEYSNSQYITFIDSDDWIHLQYLEALYNTISGNMISVCNFIRITDMLSEEKQKTIDTTVVDTELFFCERNINAVTAWGELYKKSLFESLRYPEGKLHEDEYVTYKIISCKMQNELHNTLLW